MTTFAGPRVSVFTPTHNAAHLAEVYLCLTRQTLTDWEWVVVPNGDNTDAISSMLTALVGGDARVRVVPAPFGTHGVGALKRFACEECSGELLAEVDHDDLIADDCLRKMSDALADKPFAFGFSDDATVGFDGSPHKFDPGYGWHHYDGEINNRVYAINRQFEATPRALCDILYAPDHIRVWTKAAYKIAGGHDPALTVGDDHDLVVRTYLAGAEFVHVREPLYVHRLSANTTSQTNLPLIQQTSWQTRDKHLHALVKEWCRRENLPMLDLGGAHNSPDGYIPVDPALPGYDGLTTVADLDAWKDKKYPKTLPVDVFALRYLPDNSVGCFRASDFLEHVPGDRVAGLMNLLYAKLVPGGFLLTNTPAVCDDEGRTGRGAYQDPTHVSFWSSNNFWYFTDADYAKYLNGEVKCRFQTVRVANYYPTDFHRFHLIPYVLWDGMALKDDDANYFPGPRKI